MILVLFLFTGFAFLLLGALASLACVALPPTRRYALSAALWFALWGPCTIGLMTVAGLGIVAGALANDAGHWQLSDAHRILAVLGWTYLVFGNLIAACVATGIAWLHQKVIHRLTFALFRIYVTAVSAGIGSVFGWCLGGWIAGKQLPQYGFWLWLLGMLLLIATFGVAAYKGARWLRGEAPTRFTWITAEEFAGTGKS